MESNVVITPYRKERITSIDALRAVTLLGIIIVHACGGFGLRISLCLTSQDLYLYSLNEHFLHNRCNEIFAALFGVSFYLILKNPKNTNAKFVWRSFLLLLIGLFNKLFYTQDALMWYGISGMVLVLFRNMRPRYLIITCICFLLANYILLAPLKMGNLLFGQALVSRYGADKSFSDVLLYPYAVIDYLRLVFNNGILYTISMFIFGYWVAKTGFIEHVKDRLTKRLLLIIWTIFIFSFVADYLHRDSFYLTIFSFFSASAAYASAVLYAYYHCRWCNRVLRLLEPYGKLGLTNYSIGGIFGVICITILS